MPSASTPWLALGLVAALGCAGDEDPAGSGNTSSVGSTTAATSDGTDGSDGNTGASSTGAPMFGDPIDCEGHRITGPSTITVSGGLYMDEVDLSCDLLRENDWVNWCEENAVGFQASCTTTEGTVITLGISPPQTGTFDDANGDPGYSIDVRHDGDFYSAGQPNDVQSTFTVTTLDRDARRIQGTFTGAWSDLTLETLHFPSGVIDGTFDVAF